MVQRWNTGCCFLELWKFALLISLLPLGSPFLICDEEEGYYQRKQDADEESEDKDVEKEKNDAQLNSTTTPDIREGEGANMTGKIIIINMSKDTEENLQKQHTEETCRNIQNQNKVEHAEDKSEVHEEQPEEIKLAEELGKGDREMLYLSGGLEGKMSEGTDEEKGKVGSEGEERVKTDMTFGGVLSVCEQSLEQSVVSAGLAFRHIAPPLQPPEAQSETLALAKHQAGSLNSQTLEVSTLLPPMEVQLTQVYTTRQYTRFTGHGPPVLPLTTQTHTAPSDQTILPPVPKKKTRTLYSAGECV